MTKPLFTDFEQVSAKQWKQKIQFDLKGADYNDTLIYKSLENIDVKPFYSKNDLPKNSVSIDHTTSWKNTQQIEVTETKTANTKALNAIQKGAESIYFIITKETIDPEELLQNIPVTIPIYIEPNFLSVEYCTKLNQVASHVKHELYLFTDIIGNLAKTGNWFTSLKEDYQRLGSIIKESSHLKSCLSIDLGLLQNSGATMIQQLAYGLAHANEYLHFINTDKSIDFNDKKNDLIHKNLVFKVAIGGNYFFEVAKLKALRLLWSSLSSEYRILKKCHIFAYPSHRNKTILDYNVNMLRTTTECMSAIIGNADTIYNLPYDTIYNKENDFGNRIAINQLLILKNESYFDKVNNPASGSFYIENITNQLAEKALDLFKNIEKNGGYLNQLKQGIIQRKIKESAEKEQELFNAKKLILTGVNKYKNNNENTPTIKKSVSLDKKPRKTLINPIVRRRLSEKIEKNLI
ncbi:methylmalonyl-CoA mutase subunit beta [Aquimarina addita]|uniref:Methylmalonyl-CoA mutase subunit beta n=1 Tax=Aquimarina addita TaxID=870485 RepID=A0ABP7X728_9FLAO